MPYTSGFTKLIADAAYQPQLPNLISTLPIPFGFAGAAGFGGTQCYGIRVVIPETGHLRDVSVMTSTQNGNYDLGVMDTNGASRTLLAHSGSTAFAAANAWNTWDPNLAVTAGQQVDLVVGSSSSSAQVVGANLGPSQTTLLPNASFVPTTGGAKPWMAWTNFASAFPLTNLTEASFFNCFFIPLIVARIS